MTQRQKGLLMRWAIFTVLGVVFFVLLSPFIYRPRTRTHSSVTLSDVGVTIQSGAQPGTTLVKVDDREETIPSGELGSTPLSSEAMRRLVGNTELGERYVAFSWIRFIRWWGPAAALTYWLLFRV